MRKQKLATIAASLPFLAVATILLSKAPPQNVTETSGRSPRGSTGEAQLVSEYPLGDSSEGTGESCPWQPVSLSSQATQPVPASGSVDADHPPSRTIHDPNPSFSALA